MKARQVNSCHMPEPMTPREAELYRAIHHRHCDRKEEPGHQCRGRLQIDAKGVTLSCGLCGDARRRYPEAC